LLQTLSQIDGAILVWIQENLRLEALDPLVIFFTNLGDHGMLWIVSCLLLLFHPKTRKMGFIGFLGMGIGALFTNVAFKHIFARVRPYETLAESLALVFSDDPNSFPSGHTCAAFSVASAFRHYKAWSRLSTVFLVIAVLMGCSRLYTGVHYPSDVLAGAVVGWFSGWLAVKLYRKIWPRFI